jgi:hypothetical protein
MDTVIKNVRNGLGLSNGASGGFAQKELTSPPKDILKKYVLQVEVSGIAPAVDKKNISLVDVGSVLVGVKSAQEKQMMNDMKYI